MTGVDAEKKRGKGPITLVQIGKGYEFVETVHGDRPVAAPENDFKTETEGMEGLLRTLEKYISKQMGKLNTSITLLAISAD